MTSTATSWRIALAATLVVAQFGSTLLAQDAPPATQPASPTTAPARQLSSVTKQNGGAMTLNFVDANIDVILDELSTAAGFIVVKEVKPEGRVTLVSKQPVTPEEGVSLLNTVLRKAGYAAIQQDRVLKIVNKDSAKRLNIPVRSGNDPLKIARSDELITQVIPLRYADATQLKTDLAPLISSEADFTANASSNALVITDTSANVRRVVEIVAALDTTVGSSVDVKVFQLKFATAGTAAKLINDVFGNIDSTRPQQNQGGDNNDGGGRGGGGPGGDFRRMMQAAARGNQNQSRTGKVSAAADERTNSVVVTGPSDLLTTVESVVKEIDSNPASDDAVTVYRLKNAQALNLEQVLNSLFNGTAMTNRSSTSNADTLRSARSSGSGTSGRTSGTSSSGTTGARTTGGFGTTGFGTIGGTGRTGQTFGGQTGRTANVSAAAQDAASDLAGKVSIIADTDTNSLLIRTAPANYPRVKAVIDEMDKPVRQVLIKVLLAEVTHTNGTDIGAELSVLNLRPDRTDSRGNTNVDLGAIGGSNFGISPNGAGLVVQLLEQNFEATIRLLETQGKLDVLSRPYILASDNQLASITVGQEVPLIQNSRITEDGQTINTLQYRDVGILLDVIASINPDGLVILDVAPEISALTGDSVPISDTASQPIIAKRSAQTRVGVRSGNTIVIGGLMEDRVTESISKVPLLGDIPILGEAFKRTQKNRAKTELLIFLTPHVADDPSKLVGMSNEEVKGTKLLPGAVVPGTYDEHQRGLQRGDPTTQPTTAPTDTPKEPAK